MRGKNVLTILMGKESFDRESVGKEYKLLAEAIENPNSFIFLLDEVMQIEPKDEIRHALLRAQINYLLNLSLDMENNQKRVYVAKVIEKLLFGENLLEERKKKD
jgi:hypothetical protein